MNIMKRARCVSFGVCLWRIMWRVIKIEMGLTIYISTWFRINICKKSLQLIAKIYRYKYTRSLLPAATNVSNIVLKIYNIKTIIHKFVLLSNKYTFSLDFYSSDKMFFYNISLSMYKQNILTGLTILLKSNEFYYVI